MRGDLCEYETLEDVITRLPYFIGEVYNLKGFHSMLGYRPPNEFEEALPNGEKRGLPADSHSSTCPIIGVQSKVRA